MTDLARLAGRAVGVPLGVVARRRHGKPMHPRGAVFEGVLERHGSTPETGVAWLDAQATERVVVRLSRGVGLPVPWPDLLGLAVRIPGPEPVDLLLSTAGRGTVTRLLPVVRRDAAAVYSSLMAYRSDAGPVRIAAFPQQHGVPSDPRPLAGAVARDGLGFTLVTARGLQPWRPIGRLTLEAPADPLDPDVRFDAVAHPPPGLVADGPMARFRAPAYAAARAARQPTGLRCGPPPR